MSFESLDDFFLGRSPQHVAMSVVCRWLDDRGIDHAIVGGLAMNAYGFVHVTPDVDLLLTAEGAARFESADDADLTAARTRTKVVVAGGPIVRDGSIVRWPDPRTVVVLRGLPVLPIETFIELKLIVGLSAEHRMKHLAEVQELVRFADLPEALSERLDASVRDEYLKRWRLAQAAKRDEH